MQLPAIGAFTFAGVASTHVESFMNRARVESAGNWKALPITTVSASKDEGADHQFLQRRHTYVIREMKAEASYDASAP